MAFGSALALLSLRLILSLSNIEMRGGPGNQTTILSFSAEIMTRRRFPEEEDEKIMNHLSGKVRLATGNVEWREAEASEVAILLDTKTL